MDSLRPNGITLIVLVVIAFSLSAGAAAQSRRWREIREKPLVKFDWNCASPAAYPKARLDRIVRATMKRQGFAGVRTPGDRAFIFDLNGDRKPEYFVPLECGATGNCTWGVFGLNPARSLGLVGGQYIYLHVRAGWWPDIITYGHFSASEGHLGTYSFRKRGYAWLGDSYRTEVRGGIYGNKIPSFLERARAACENIGS